MVLRERSLGWNEENDGKSYVILCLGDITTERMSIACRKVYGMT